MKNDRKKSIVAINLGNFGSTGSIMDEICKAAEREGYITYKAYPEHELNRSKQKNDILIISKFMWQRCKSLSYKTGYNGCFAVISTILFLNKLSKIKPDIIHLHNLHNSYINLPLLFGYIKKNNIKVIWTLHDCWAFTGHCPHFTMIKCDRWKTGCYECPQPDCYPRMKRDKSSQMWKLKRKWFNGIKDLTIVTPSQWLADLVKQSFLSEYPVKVINNGINCITFSPKSNNLRDTYNISKDRKILLGVSFGWDNRKGLDVFIELAKRLDKRYQIVLIGTDEKTDRLLPDQIISIHRMENPRKLAEIYTEADVFVNPTREEVLGLVNLEALACGTPVITFKSGGSPECINKECGIVVPCDDVETMEREIIRLCESQSDMTDACIAQAHLFDMDLKLAEYISLY